jgi:SAM-dependent methyltransferase
MAEFRDYKRYVSDPKWAKTYSDYQQRYVANPRESDKKSARLVLSELWRLQPLDHTPRILDLGCSTGNFLRHLKQLIPTAELVGGDLMAPVIDECRADPSLQGISFEVMDIFAIPKDKPFDVIVINAVTYLFDKDQLDKALLSVAAALGPGGAYIGYEFVYPGDVQQTIYETSAAHPEGLRLILRSEDNTRAALQSVGFYEVDVIPFDIPIDLPKPEQDGTDAALITYTRRDDLTNRRLMFRGDLYQPWSHMVARRAV